MHIYTHINEYSSTLLPLFLQLNIEHSSDQIINLGLKRNTDLKKYQKSKPWHSLLKACWQ